MLFFSVIFRKFSKKRRLVDHFLNLENDLIGIELIVLFMGFSLSSSEVIINIIPIDILYFKIANDFPCRVSVNYEYNKS